MLRFNLGPYHFNFNSPPPPEDDKPKLKPHPLYKPPKAEAPPPLPEYFPLAAQATTHADLPPVPSWNKPPVPHVQETTRLYIGFTRYWPLLQQVVLGYITAGWPPEDIYVVENTGTFDANKEGLLTSQNPFYLDYNRLTNIFGVNVITMPSLQSFAQLQNFYLSEAINNNMSYYFWAHMDTVPQTHEDAKPYKSLYQIAVDVIRESMAPDFRVDEKTGKPENWAIRFFSYDWLALVKTEAYQQVGGWDSMISYYGTDCDMHSRLGMNGLTTPIADAGQVFDVGESLPDLEVLFRRKKKPGVRKREEQTTGSTGDQGMQNVGINDNGKMEAKPNGEDGKGTENTIEDVEKTTKATGSTFDDEKQMVTVGEHGKVTFGATNNTAVPVKDNNGPPIDMHPKKPATDGEIQSASTKVYLTDTEEDTLGSETWKELQVTLEAMAEEKRKDPYRNSWQLKQRGGQGEPYYVDADGWERALQMTIEAGGRIMEEKWGHRGCDIRDVGLKEGDQWRVEHDW